VSVSGSDRFAEFVVSWSLGVATGFLRAADLSRNGAPAAAARGIALWWSVPVVGDSEVAEPFKVWCLSDDIRP